MTEGGLPHANGMRDARLSQTNRPTHSGRGVIDGKSLNDYEGEAPECLQHGTSGAAEEPLRAVRPPPGLHPKVRLVPDLFPEALA